MDNNNNSLGQFFGTTFGILGGIEFGPDLFFAMGYKIIATIFFAALGWGTSMILTKWWKRYEKNQRNRKNDMDNTN